MLQGREQIFQDLDDTHARITADTLIDFAQLQRPLLVVANPGKLLLPSALAWLVWTLLKHKLP